MNDLPIILPPLASDSVCSTAGRVWNKVMMNLSHRQLKNESSNFLPSFFFLFPWQLLTGTVNYA